MSDLKRVLMKREEIISDEAEDLIKAAMRNRIFRVPMVKKDSMHICFKRLGLVRRLNKLAGGNSLKNK